jgi:hypothetical protein
VNDIEDTDTWLWGNESERGHGKPEDKAIIAILQDYVKGGYADRSIDKGYHDYYYNKIACFDDYVVIKGNYGINIYRNGFHVREWKTESNGSTDIYVRKADK